MSKIKNALTRKFGVGKLKLPAWLWLALFAAGVYLYRRHQAATAATTSTTSTGTTALPTAQPLTGGYGAAGASLGVPSQPDQYSSGVGAPVVYDPLADTYGPLPVAATAPTSQAATPAPAPVAAPPGTSSGNPAGRVHLSQPLNRGTLAHPKSGSVLVYQGNTSKLVQPLLWGGQKFYSQSAFDKWAAAHGTTSATIFANHPEAQRIYNQLTTGTIGFTPVPPKLATSTTTRARTVQTPAVVPTKPVQVAAPAIVNPKSVQAPKGTSTKPAQARAKSTPSPAAQSPRNALTLSRSTGRAVAL